MRMRDTPFAAWISVSGRRLILRTPLQPDGHPGPIETAATHVLADDFAFGASSSLYIATHPEQTVFRLDAAGNRTTVAGAKQGGGGTTACGVGGAPGGEDMVFVTT